MSRKLFAGSALVDNPFDELLYLERYHMSNLKGKSREELYEAFSQRIREIECEMTFLKKQVRERDLRIQLYQFSSDKLEELKENLDSHPNLDDIWNDFEIAYKIATGKNLIRFEELEEKRKKYQKQIDSL